MSKRNYKAGWCLISCFIFFIACSSPQEKMLHKKWYLTAVAVSNVSEADSLNSDSTAPHKSEVGKLVTDTLRMEGTTDYFDFSGNKTYSAQLMGGATNGTYHFNDTAKTIIRHSETTNSTDTIDVKKLTKDTLILYERENMLTMTLVANK